MDNLKSSEQIGSTILINSTLCYVSLLPSFASMMPFDPVPTLAPPGFLKMVLNSLKICS